MHGRVKTRVRLADRSADRPRGLGLLAVGLGALCAGLAVAHGLRRLEPVAPSVRPKAVATAERDAGLAAREPLAAAAPSPSTREINGVAHASEGTGDLAANAPRATDAAPAAPALLAAPQLAPHFELGIVAYDRCDGLPQRPGRFPCPRDLQLEQHVWHALRALESCELASSQRGQAEVRFDFSGSPAATIRVRAPAKDGLDRAVVTKCAGLALSGARTTLASEHMVVRFRFELR